MGHWLHSTPLRSRGDSLQWLVEAECLCVVLVSFLPLTQSSTMFTTTRRNVTSRHIEQESSHTHMSKGSKPTVTNDCTDGWKISSRLTVAFEKNSCQCTYASLALHVETLKCSALFMCRLCAVMLPSLNVKQHVFCSPNHIIAYTLKTCWNITFHKHKQMTVRQDCNFRLKCFTNYACPARIQENMRLWQAQNMWPSLQFQLVLPQRYHQKTLQKSGNHSRILSLSQAALASCTYADKWHCHVHVFDDD